MKTSAEAMTVNICNYIRKLRIANNYSQYDMANLLNISQNSYCQLENGRTKITLNHICALAAVFELTTQQFMQHYFETNAHFEKNK